MNKHNHKQKYNTVLYKSGGDGGWEIHKLGHCAFCAYCKWKTCPKTKQKTQSQTSAQHCTV